MSTTITGNINDLTGTAVTSNCYVRFWLRGCNGNQPRVGGAALIAPDNGPTYWQDFVPNGSGQISGTLYSNDVNISAGGQVGVTWYDLQVFLNGQGGAYTPYALADGTTFNLNSAAPITTNPVVAAPTGDSTYARLDGGNQPFTAGIRVNNSGTGNTFNIAGGEIWVPPGGSIQAAINSLTTGVVRLQPGIYALGTTGITLKSGVQLIGANESSSILTYTGTGAAVLLDSTTEAAVRRVQIQIGSSATAIGLDVQNTTADSKWNTIENVQIQTTGGTFTSGQIGFRYMCSTTFALYWNTMIGCQTVKLDTGFQLTNLGAFSTNGCNDNKFYSLSAHFFTTGMLINKFATENQIYGLTGSASGQVANNTLLQIGNSSNTAHGNMIYGIVADTGAAGQAYVITSGVNYTYLSGVYDTAGRASTNAGTGTIVNGFRNASSQANWMPNGSASNPSLAALASTGSGIFWSGGGQMLFSALGTSAVEVSLSPPGLRIRSDGAYGFASAADPDGTNDTMLGRGGAGIVTVDTTTVGNAAGTLKSTSLQLLGKNTTYNNISTAGNGLASVYGSTSQKSESAADANVLTFTPPAVVGSYRVRFTMAVSAQNTATLGWTATWKDANASAQAPTNLALFTSGTAAPALTVTAATNGNYYGSIDIDTDASATAIVVKLTFAGTSFTAKVSATVERIA